MQTVIFAILGLVSMVVGLLLSIILPEIKIFAWGLIGFGIILVAAAAIIDFRRVKGAVTSRRGKFGTSTSVMVTVFAGIIVLVNAISIGVNHSFDFTALSQFTLTSQTKDILAKLDTPVTVLCFFIPADDANHTGAYAFSMLAQYEKYTSNLQLKFVDPDQHPEEARQYGITDSTLYESVVFETPKAQCLVSPAEILSQAEHSFTNAILLVTGIQEKKVYFATGDGEASPTDALSAAADALKTNLLQVETIDLQLTSSIPSDCAVLIIAGPTQAMTDSERQIVANYISPPGGNGPYGYTLIMTNPNSPDDVAKLLAPWGVDVKSGTIIDPDSYVTGNIDSPTIPKSRDNMGLDNVYFPGATAIIPQNTAPTNMEVNPLVWTSANSWLEKNYDPTTTPKFDPATDTKASYAIGVLINPTYQYDSQGNATGINQGPYIVAFGDSDFITNSHFYDGNNGDMFLNLVKALGAGTDIVTIENKGLQTRRLILSPEAESFLNVSSIALLPAIVLIIGALMWWRRR